LAVFFAALTFAQRARCADAILFRAAAEALGQRQFPSVSVPSVRVFGGTRILNLDFARLQNLTPSGGLDQNAVSTMQVALSDDCTIPEQSRTLDYIDQPDSRNGASIRVFVFQKPDSIPVDSSNRSRHMFLELDTI
jgi:hypothetical protein